MTAPTPTKKTQKGKAKPKKDALTFNFSAPRLTSVGFQTLEPEEEPQNKPEVTVQLNANLSRSAPESVTMALNAKVDGHPDFRLHVMFQSVFTVQNATAGTPGEKLDEVLRDAIASVGVQLLFPYLRQIIGDLVLQATGQAFILPALDPRIPGPDDLPSYEQSPAAPKGARSNDSRVTVKRKKGSKP